MGKKTDAQAQLELIPKSPGDRIRSLGNALRKFGKHSLYCTWVDGRYDRALGCTCGLEEALRDAGED